MPTLASIKSPGVYVQEMPARSRPITGVGTATAAFVGVTADGPFNDSRRITNWAQYLSTFGGWVEGAYMPQAVYQFFDNGGGSCYICRIGQPSGGGAGHASAELTSASRAGATVYRLEARAAGPAGDGITVRVEPESEPASPESGGDSGGRGVGDSTFSLVVRQGDIEERYEGLTPRKGPGRSDLVTALQVSTLLQAAEVSGVAVADRVPASGEVVLMGGAALPVSLAVQDYLGDEASRSGIAGLAALDDVTMVVTPDLMAAYEAGQLDLDAVRTVQNAVVSHCEEIKGRMAILDTPKGLGAQQVFEWVTEKARFSSPYAVIYWPWLSFYDPGLRSSRLMPPSGAVAGVWGRNDDTHGVHVAPANEPVTGALDLEISATLRERDQLNPVGINVIRPMPGGILVYGARTQASDSSWRYVNVRRLFNYIEASIIQGTQWVVFEPNDLDLWQRIKRTVQAFLLGLWRDGALFGATPDAAYYVKCDAETNPPDVIAAGFVVIEIGIAPVTPAEFVVFRISQLPTGGAVQE